MVNVKPVKTGVIGLGAIGERLINGFKENSQINVSAVCDIDPTRARKVAEGLDGANWFTEYSELLAVKDIELVYVAVPPAFHKAVVLEAVQQGKHILCEKPLANSLEEAHQMWKAAEGAGIVHAMNFPLNYSTGLNKMAELLANGYIGDLRRINLSMHFPQWPRAWQQNAWVGGREQGGYVLEVGAHFIQAILKMFGSITSVRSEIQFPADPAASETGIIATMRLQDGTAVLVDGMSHIAGEERLALTLFGSKGTLSLENWSSLKGGQIGEKIKEIPLDGFQVKSRLIDEVVKAIRGESAELYDFKVGYEVQAVLEALRRPNSDNWNEI